MEIIKLAEKIEAGFVNREKAIADAKEAMSIESNKLAKKVRRLNKLSKELDSREETLKVGEAGVSVIEQKLLREKDLQQLRAEAHADLEKSKETRRSTLEELGEIKNKLADLSKRETAQGKKERTYKKELMETFLVSLHTKLEKGL